MPVRCGSRWRSRFPASGLITCRARELLGDGGEAVLAKLDALRQTPAAGQVHDHLGSLSRIPVRKLRSTSLTGTPGLQPCFRPAGACAILLARSPARCPAGASACHCETWVLRCGPGYPTRTRDWLSQSSGPQADIGPAQAQHFTAVQAIQGQAPCGIQPVRRCFSQKFPDLGPAPRFPAPTAA
jgi:hypothetical protein